jgi:hypothetical protein
MIHVKKMRKRQNEPQRHAKWYRRRHVLSLQNVLVLGMDSKHLMDW